ncbi:MAG: amidohydrolase family protein, partial [Bacteroidota bacterium]|nr:amidohydrolase family protein [Bacteroidota bacterium]
MKFILACVCFFIVTTATSKDKADLLVYNAHVYTIDNNFTITEAIAVREGKIIDVGKSADLLDKYEATTTIDAKGKYLFPGLIDAHAHFVEYGLSLQNAGLVGTTSWPQILDKLKTFSVKNKNGWIVGNGWDQNDWKVKEFPNNEKLNELFPGRPVILSRVDGHAAIANKKALELAGIKPGDKLTGGEIEVKDGKLTGILIDNATSLVYSKIPSPSYEEIKAALLEAQKNCFAAGLTTIDDCGLSYQMAQFIQSL